MRESKSLGLETCDRNVFGQHKLLFPITNYKKCGENITDYNMQ